MRTRELIIWELVLTEEIVPAQPSDAPFHHFKPALLWPAYHSPAHSTHTTPQVNFRMALLTTIMLFFSCCVGGCCVFTTTSSTSKFWRQNFNAQRNRRISSAPFAHIAAQSIRRVAPDNLLHEGVNIRYQCIAYTILFTTHSYFNYAMPKIN